MHLNQRTELEAAARQVACYAYAPYSRFKVGAAILGSSGTIYTGANVENASYGLTLCAERVALASARSAGEQNIVAICVACIDVAPDAKLQEKVPCGACRQWIQELAPDAEIIVAGEQRVFRIEDFLPNPFSLRKS